MATHDNLGSRKDPHMKSPMPGFIITILVVAALVVVGYIAYGVLGDERDSTEDRAKDGKQTEAPIRNK